MSIFTSTPRQAKKNIEYCLNAGLVPFIQSSPGIGKSSIVRQIASEYNLELIDHRLSTSDPTDLSGFPHFENGVASFVPFNVFPVEGTKIPKGKNGFLLFLDEFNSASRAVQAACYKIVLDRMVGQHKLHPNCYIVCAGNLSTDRAITNNLSTAMQSRVVHIHMESSFKDWLEDVALTEGYDEKIISFLSMNPQYLMNFNPDHQEWTFACPRTWSFINSILKNNEVPVEDLSSLIIGTIGEGIGVNFVEHSKIYKEMPTYQEIVNNPTSTSIGSTHAIQWAIACSLARNMQTQDLSAIIKYMLRMDASKLAIFARMLLKEHPTIITEPDFQQITKYLYQVLA